MAGFYKTEGLYNNYYCIEKSASNEAEILDISYRIKK